MDPLAPLPSLEALRCFSEAARLLNFRAAAGRVALTPAALGQRIRQLEADVGARLFHRTTRRVELTPAGLALVPHARGALEAAETCVRAARGEVGPAPIEIVLGTRHELGTTWILPMLSRLRAAQPGLTLHLYFGSGPDLLLRVRAQEIDCAVASVRVTDPRLESIRLHEERYAFVAHPALLARAPLARAEHAPGHTLIDAGPDLPLFRYWRDAPGGGDRLAFGRILRVGATGPIRALVLRGEGVAVLPHYLVAPDLAARRLVRVFPGVKLLSDWFRLIFRADDPRRSVYARLAEEMLRAPLR